MQQLPRDQESTAGPQCDLPLAPPPGLTTLAAHSGEHVHSMRGPLMPRSALAAAVCEQSAGGDGSSTPPCTQIGGLRPDNLGLSWTEYCHGALPLAVSPACMRVRELDAPSRGSLCSLFLPGESLGPYVYALNSMLSTFFLHSASILHPYQNRSVLSHFSFILAASIG